MTRPKARATDVGGRPFAIAPQPKKTRAKVPRNSAAIGPQARAGRRGRPAARSATSMKGRRRADTSVSVRRNAASFSSSEPSTSDGSSRSPVQRVRGSREHRAGRAGAIADRDDVVERLVQELGDRLAAGGTPVDAGLLDDPERERVDPGHLGARRKDLEVIAAIPLEQRLGDLASWPSCACRRTGRGSDRRTRGAPSVTARPAAAMVISRSSSSPSSRSRSARCRAMPWRCSATSGARSRSTAPRSRHRRARRPASSGARPRRRSDSTRRSRARSTSSYSR